MVGGIVKTCVVLQPNGLFARFSSVVDTFTHVNMTRSEAFRVFVGRLCARNGIPNCVGEVQNVDADDAQAIVQRAIEAAIAEPERWRDGLDTVRMVHGKKRARRIKRDGRIK